MSYFFSNFFILGSRRDDTLSGNNWSNVIYGGRRDDTIDGRGGNDWLFGGRGDDMIFGGTGRDYLDGGKGDDYLDGGAGLDYVYGGHGNDTLVWTAAENTSRWADQYSGDGGRDTLVINLTSAEYTEALRLEIVEYMDFIAANTRGNGQANGRSFSFDEINLDVRKIEYVQVMVDGEVVDPSTPPNIAPVATDVVASADEDSDAIIVTADFVDPDGDDVHSFSVDTDGTLGTVINNGDGTFSYDPNGQFDDLNDGETATDSFTYTVDDGNGGVSTATVTVTIAGLNNNTAPVAQSIVTHGVNGPQRDITEVPDLVGQLLATDADGDTLTFSRVPGDTQSGVSISATGEYSVDPGTTSFDYLVSDGNGGESIGTVTFVNEAPVASDNEFFIEPGGPTAFFLDIFDPDGDNLYVGSELNFEISSQTFVNFSTNGAISFTNLNGDIANQSFTFDYTVFDGHGGSDEASVTVHFGDFVAFPPPPPPPPPPAPSDNAPIAQDAVIEVNADTVSSTGTLSFQLDASDLDGDDLTFEFRGQDGGYGFGPNGDSLITVSDSGLVTVQLVGEVSSGQSLSLGYTVSDGTGRSDNGAITLNIGDLPVFAAPPTAVDDVFNLNDDELTEEAWPGGPLTDRNFDLLGNDSDVNGDMITLLSVDGLVTTAAGRTVTIYRQDGSINFGGAQFAEMGADESDSFTVNYTISDGNGGTDTGTATFNIQGVNEAPTITGYSGGQDYFSGGTIYLNGSTSAFDISILDVDSDSADLTLTLLEGEGITFTALATANGGLRYEMNVDFSVAGSQTVVYEVSDGDGGVTVETVQIIDNRPPPPPPPPGQSEKGDMSTLNAQDADAQMYDLSEFISDDDYFIEAPSTGVSAAPLEDFFSLDSDFTNPQSTSGGTDGAMGSQGLMNPSDYDMAAMWSDWIDMSHIEGWDIAS